MSIFKKKRQEEKKVIRVLEGADPQWADSLPGEEYIDQNHRIRVGMASRIGTRVYQQDTAAVRWIGNSLIVAMVCDGMGGLTSGDVASRNAIEAVMEGIDAAAAEETLSSERLFEIIREANDRVRGIRDEEGDPIACGTTLTLVIIKEDLAVWMSIGDSRIYYLSQKGLQCVTKEHNYVLMARLRGEEPDPQVRPDTLVSFLGAQEIKYIDYNTVPWKLGEGDMLLLCSDGLPRLVEDRRIEALLLGEEKDPDALAEALAQEASGNAVQRQDNTTVVILKFKE